MNRPFPWKCRECRERAVSPATVDYVTELEHDGRLYPVTVNDLTVLRCEKCGSMQLPDASHERLMVALRRAAGLLTPNQITTRRSALGLNQKAFAQLLGVAPATVCRWESGGQIQQRVMNDFITAFFEVPELRAYLSKVRGVALPQPAEGRVPGASTAVQVTILDLPSGGFSIVDDQTGSRGTLAGLAEIR